MHNASVPFALVDDVPRAAALCYSCHIAMWCMCPAWVCLLLYLLHVPPL